jgi:hypothetical protein
MYSWECKGAATYGNLLIEADGTLGRAREQEAAETRLKILEDGRDKPVNLADAMLLEAENRTGEEIIELKDEILYEGNLQNMAQMLMSPDNLDRRVHAQVALEEVNEAANNSRIRIFGLRKKLELLPTGSEVGSITSQEKSGEHIDRHITILMTWSP